MTHDPKQDSETIQVQSFQNPPGECHSLMKDEHVLFMSLNVRSIHYLQSQDGKTSTGLFRKGDLMLVPAGSPIFTRWQGDEQCLQIGLSDRFFSHIAQETLDQESRHLQLQPIFQMRDTHLEAIASMLLTETQNSNGNNLYLDSLANVLAINLLRNHATTQPIFPNYEGGLPPHQLRQVLDYIEAHLEQPIKLEALARLLDISQFHFSRLFKQSIGLSPYQYLIQQRVERAKHLLKTSDRLIVDIALECGFNSHSHLSKQFRQLTGVTPKAYRVG
ncbi:MAG: helix-turn-helix domain-containing protein [Merismopedia sp. SIO2A8]|nr:helix-turn-helix domain-containing protein [Merismopedia sp. SIO2A8]